jgi:hypothetical protein
MECYFALVDMCSFDDAEAPMVNPMLPTRRETAVRFGGGKQWIATPLNSKFGLGN